jgi:hypothetical protein
MPAGMGAMETTQSFVEMYVWLVDVGDKYRWWLMMPFEFGNFV